jgi:histone-lysine N-methyltransferase SETMAR
MARNKISDILEGRILELLHQGYSQPQIVKILKGDGITVAQSTISNVKRKIGRQRNSKSKIKIFQKRPSQTPTIVNKVIEQIDVNDPPTQRAVAKSVHVSQSTVSRIIKNAGFTLRKKRKMHKLTMSAIEKRCRRARRLYRQLANGRYRKFITTDESWFYLDGTEGKRKVCYIKKSDPNYERLIFEQDSSRPAGFMVWGGISSKGKTSLRFVQPGAKINSQYYITKILKPFLSHDLPRLYPESEKIKPVFHQDSAPSHTSKATITYLNESKINYVKPEEWMPKSPDVAPMDYAIWGHLKQRLNKKKIETLDELKKKLLYEWKKMAQSYIDRVLAYWPKRAFLVFKARGFHIEHRLKL